MDNKDILALVQEQDEFMRKTRRYLHEYPEISSEEVETSSFLKQAVRDLGLEVVETTKTGFYAVIDTGRPGKTVAVRTDIDALPMQEATRNLSQERTCISKNAGAMHACGHDGHMSVELALAKILVSKKEELNGKIILLFEEGEEIGTGIDGMIEGIKNLGIDVVYGTHFTSFMKTGEICLDAGPRMAAVAIVNFDVVGRGGHGSRPDLSISPIFASAQVLSGIASAWANQVDVTKTVTLGLGQIHGGTVNNVIPDRVSIGGTLRYFDVEEGKHAVEVLNNVAVNTAKAHNCSIEFAKDHGPVTVPVINDETYSKIAQSGVEELYPNHLVHDVTWFASESFAKYRQIAPIVFSFVGMGNEKVGSGAEHHNINFDLDEDAMAYSLGATLKFVTNVLK